MADPSLCFLASVQIGNVNSIIMVVTAAIVIFLLFGVWKALQSHRTQPTTGREGLIGQSGRTITDLDPDGQIELRGEIWKATAVGGNLEKDSRVVVIDEKGLTLYVRAA